jgi:hypothetical protein
MRTSRQFPEVSVPGAGTIVGRLDRTRTAHERREIAFSETTYQGLVLDVP